MSVNDANVQKRIDTGKSDTEATMPDYYANKEKNR